jgi:hypothetical protein
MLLMSMSMSARFSRRFPAWPLWRLVLLLLLTPALVVAPALVADTAALAQDDDEEDEEDDEDSEDEDEGEEEEEDFEDEGEEEEEDGEPQPPVTAGGMFTKKTYPVAELDRPLTVIQGMFEVRGGIDIDVSDQTAFELFRLKLDGRYGIADHIELQAIIDFLIGGDRALLLPPAPPPEDPDAVTGVTSNVGLFGFGFEGALYYDVVHFRSIAALTILPAGANAEETDVGFDLILGVPFRYRIKPQIAIVALDEIMTIHFAGGKPDLTVGVGGVFQVIPQVALTARAELFVPAFNTELLTVPLTAAAQFSPNNQFDIGIEFTLNTDVRNEETRFDKRSALLFVQTRL